MTDPVSFALEQVAAWETRLRRLVTPAAQDSALDVATFEALFASRRLAETANQPGLPEALLRARLGLTDTELDCLWLLASIALSPEARATAVALYGGSGDLTASAMQRLVYRGAMVVALRELGALGKLRRLGLIERCDGGGSLMHESHWTWAIAPRVLQFLHDPDTKDDSLSTLARPIVMRAVSELAVDQNAVETARGALRTSSIIMATGLPGLGRRSLLVALAAEAGRQVIEVNLKRTSKDAAILGSQLRAVARECRLLDRVPLVTNLDALDADRVDLIISELERVIDGPMLVTCGLQRPRMEWMKPVVLVEMSPVTSAQRRCLWRDALGDINEKDIEHLVTHYPLAPSLLVQAARAAKARAAESSLSADHIRHGIRAVLDDRLGHFAKRVAVTQTWDDLVLPADQVSSVLELMARIRERRRVYEDWGFAAKVGKGLGTSALFSGPPGTGKTMVAALIAKDLGLELYQVDLGKIVSKYIGETEKNLAALFDAAEAGHAVLLFDEADSLFGKRTEVKSSNDRYANLETNYLLQRLESFTGICLLTSNHETNIDPAFLRRLSLHLRFELPDVEERAHLWRAMLPKQAPVDGNVDVEVLAKRYAMSGGYIRNAALRAAFLAANDDSTITVAHLERAARSEYEGMGKIVAS